MTATEVQHRLIAQVAETMDGRADPGFVVEIVGVAEPQPIGLGGIGHRPRPGLPVVEVLFAPQAVRRRHEKLHSMLGGE
jgi:hypothetical protein